MKKDSSSVTGSKRLMVAPSPLNEVKLELGVVLTVGIVLLLVQERLLSDWTLQLLLLSSYGLLGMMWIMIRTRRVLARFAREQQPTSHDAH